MGVAIKRKQIFGVLPKVAELKSISLLFFFFLISDLHSGKILGYWVENGTEGWRVEEAGKG